MSFDINHVILSGTLHKFHYSEVAYTFSGKITVTNDYDEPCSFFFIYEEDEDDHYRHLSYPFQKAYEGCRILIKGTLGINSDKATVIICDSIDFDSAEDY